MTQADEEKQWDLYCAIAANPLADDIGSFDEFKLRMSGGKEKVKIKENNGLKQNQIVAQVKKSEAILRGFDPTKGGE